jgi:NitT/TauT family transport system permease protein
MTQKQSLVRASFWRSTRSLDGLIVSIGLLLIWEFGTRLGKVPSYLLPPPSNVAVRLWTDFPQILSHTITTTGEILLGFGLAIVVSIPMAALLAQSQLAERFLHPILVLSQTIPKVAIAPLLVAWFGFGLTPKILIAFTMCFFPIVVDALTGFKSAPAQLRWLALSAGATRWQTFVHFQVPSALPHIFAGLKVASTLAIVGAVVGEFVAADRGLGYQLIVANGALDATLSFSILVVLSVLGAALYGLVDLFERLLLPWHVSQRLHGGGR